MNAMLATALVLGVAGSAHCVGMCGPIALAVPSPSNTWSARVWSTVLLNSGRLVSYTLLGAAIGVFGVGMRLVGLQQVVSIAAGALLLLTVVVPGLLERWSPTGQVALLLGRLRRALAQNLKRTAPEALFFTGMLNGLLPCGLVYAALIGAGTMASSVDGAMYMALFAVGTWPALFAIRLSKDLFGDRMRGALRHISPALVTVVAVLMILRGLELGIPYVSPAGVPIGAEVTACH